MSQSAVTNGAVRLRYVIMDGGSSDGTIDAIRTAVGNHPAVAIVSERDYGMYDALVKGWIRSGGGDVFAYLNAGDSWFPEAFAVVDELIDSHPWLCGYQVQVNTREQLTSAKLPFRFRRKLILSGAYGSRLPYIQQESSFWSGPLMQTVDLDRLRTFRLAGDAYLWHCFARAGYEPTVVSAMLGAFKVEHGQLSADLSAYSAEVASFQERASTLLERLAAASDALLWRAPDGLKVRVARGHLLSYDHRQQRWR